MIWHKLTRGADAAIPSRMAQRTTRQWTIGKKMAVAGFCTLLAGGCINVSAPDKPIVINLNINIKQEVVYRLAGDAREAIDENAEIF